MHKKKIIYLKLLFILLLILIYQVYQLSSNANDPFYFFFYKGRCSYHTTYELSVYHRLRNADLIKGLISIYS